MRRSAWHVLLAWLLFDPASGGANAAEGLQLKAVSVHLFLEKSGSFSPDIAAMPDFYSWNFEPTGTGIPSGEKFSAILIKVRMVSPKEIFSKGKQGRLTVVSLNDKKLVRNESIENVYVGENGEVYRAFYVSDIACKALELTATIRGKTITKELPFRCGE